MIPRIIQTITYWPIYLTLRLFTDFRVKGQKNLGGLGDRGIIFASNHASYIDGPVCAAAMPCEESKLFPKKFFPIRFLVADEFFSWRNSFFFPLSLFVAFYVRINGSVPVKKTGGKLHKSLFPVVKRLRNKAKIWIYPEGKIGHSKKKLQPGKRGIAYLYNRTRLPIVPVAILGTYNLSLLKFLSGKTKIRVKIGKPIYLPEDKPLEAEVKIVMRKINKLLN